MKNVITTGGWNSAVRLLAVRVFAAGVCPVAAAKGTGTVLSEQGCGRATAYSEFNKIVTVRQRTHVSWLDSVGGRFLVKIRTFDRAKDGVMYLAVTTVDANVSAAEAMWGHPSAEVILLVSRDKGRSFGVHAVSATDDSVPNWLPNLERPTGGKPTGVPSLIYTHGHRGANNKQIMSNDVVWCDVRALIGEN